MKIDKKQIKAYSKEISKICKLWGYNPSNDRFEDYFEDASYFDSIPYIKELSETNEDEDFMEKFGYAIDEVYDSTVEVSLKEVKDYIKKNNISLGKFLLSISLSRGIESEFIIDWFLGNTNDETIQKFINWALE